MCTLCDGFGLMFSVCGSCGQRFPWSRWDEAVYGPFVVGIPAGSPAAADSDVSPMWLGGSVPLNCSDCCPDGYVHPVLE